MHSFLIDRALRFGKELTLISGLTVLASLATLALPWLAGQLLADVVAADSGSSERTVLLLLLALVCSTVLNIGAAIVSARTSGRILASLQQEAYCQIQHLPLAFHDNSEQGDVLALMTYEVGSLSTFLTATLAQVPALLLTAAGSTVLLFLLNPVLALIVPLLVPLFFITLRLVGRSLRGIARQGQEAQGRMFSLAEAHLEILPATKSFAMEERQAQVYAGAVEQARRLSFAHARITALLGPLVALVAALAAVGMLLLAGGEAGALGDDPAQLFSFLLYAALLTRPVGSLAAVYGMYQVARGTLARLERVFAEPAERGFAETALPSACQGAIVFERVSFAYRGRETVLDAADLSIAAGETIALTGENGAGKSTLINLLLRFYEPSAGIIRIDGQDIAGMQVQAVRRLMGYVPQRALLFNGTVRENICFGLPQASEQQLRKAAGLAQALDFIDKLPDGFETRIGDHGVRLSGGQRQRIALARALLVNPPVLILDEATSEYDLEGEASFVAACQDALHDRTVIIVTHRPASLALADRVYCVENGKVRQLPG